MLDTWLHRYALTNQRLGGTRTYVMALGAEVRGYYALTPSSIEFEHASTTVRRGLGRYPVPVILLARLAVDRRWQGRGLGARLLRDALLRSLRASEAIGGVAVLVHAIDDGARAFYERFDFEPSTVDPYTLLVTMNDIASNLDPSES